MGGRRRWFRAVALDYDGTLATEGHVAPGVGAALAKARRDGLRLVLVTGRILEELRAVFPDVDSCFDAIVGENGAVLSTGGCHRVLVEPVDAALDEELGRRGIAHRRGEVLVGCAAADEHGVLSAVRRLGLELQLVRNRSELMIVPPGITKGTGLLAALATLGLSHHNTVAVGDGENDHSLLHAAEMGVAVADAVPSLKEQADLVLERSNGEGARELLGGGVLADRVVIHPARWSVVLGADDNGEPVRLPASQLNVLVAGGSGDGKSYVTGLLAEQLMALDYSVLVLDPEGDHVGLGRLPGVLVLGGQFHLPPPAAVVPLLRHREASLVLDLSHLDPTAQDVYLALLPAEIEAQRAATGLPHWLIVDEAQRAIGPHGPALPVFDPARKGHCLVTWRPAKLSADALVGVDAVLALTNPAPQESLVDITAAVAGMPRAEIAGLLTGPTGRCVVVQRASPGQAVVVRTGPRRTRHFRHDEKYSVTTVDPGRRFFVRDEDDRDRGSVGNLVELEELLATCDRSVLRHHCGNRDLSRWVRDVFHDTRLASRLRAAEEVLDGGAPAAVAEAVRLDLIAALQRRRAR